MEDDTSGSLRTVVKGASILFIGTILSKALMYLYRLIVARIGPEAYGELSLALGVFWVGVTLAQLGLPAGVKRHVSEYIGKEDSAGTRGAIFTSLAVTLPFAVVITVIILLSADVIAVSVFNTPSLSLYIRVLAFAIPFQVIFKNSSVIVHAFREFKYFVYVDHIFRSTMVVGITILLLATGHGLMGAVIAQAVAAILSAILILYYVQSRVFPLFTHEATPRMQYGELISFSWPLLLSGIIGLILGWTDTFMLGALRSTSDVGVYNAALPTAQLLSVAGGALATSLFPWVIELYNTEREDGAVQMTSVTLKWIFIVTFPGLLLMVVFARPALRLLFGPTYEAGALALGILGTAYFLKTMTQYADSFIQSEDMTKLVMLNSLVAALLNVLLNYVLIKQYGGAGAAIGTTLSLVFAGALAAAEVKYLFGVQPFKFSKFIPATIAATTAAGAVFGVAQYFFMYTPRWFLFVGIILYGALYLLFFIILGGLEEEDVDILLALEKKMGRDFTLLKNIVRRLNRKKLWRRLKQR